MLNDVNTLFFDKTTTMNSVFTNNIVEKLQMAIAELHGQNPKLQLLLQDIIKDVYAQSVVQLKFRHEVDPETLLRGIPEIVLDDI